MASLFHCPKCLCNRTGQKAMVRGGAVTLRLAKYGCNNRPYHHIVAIKSRRPREGKPIEQIGIFDPMPNTRGEKVVSIDFQRLEHYLVRRAKPSKSLSRLLGLCGYYPLDPMVYITAKRNLKAAEAKAEKERRKAEAQTAPS